MNTILGFRPPLRPALASHVQWSGDNQLLSAPEVAAVRDFMDEQTLHPGTIGNDGSAPGVHNESYRSVLNASVPYVGFQWLYERIQQRVQWANDELFRFTLSGIVEPIGYLKYEPASEENPEPGHYNWHQDFGGGQYATRKLSLVVQLSDDDEYKGCELELCTDKIWPVPHKTAGDAVMFPSWTPHRVTNIESGVRQALVVWVHGPQFQ